MKSQKIEFLSCLQFPVIGFKFDDSCGLLISKLTNALQNSFPDIWEIKCEGNFIQILGKDESGEIYFNDPAITSLILEIFGGFDLDIVNYDIIIGHDRRRRPLYIMTVHYIYP